MRRYGRVGAIAVEGKVNHYEGPYIYLTVNRAPIYWEATSAKPTEYLCPR